MSLSLRTHWECIGVLFLNYSLIIITFLCYCYSVSIYFELCFLLYQMGVTIAFKVGGYCEYHP